MLPVPLACCPHHAAAHATVPPCCSRLLFHPRARRHAEAQRTYNKKLAAVRSAVADIGDAWLQRSECSEKSFNQRGAVHGARDRPTSGQDLEEISGGSTAASGGESVDGDESDVAGEGTGLAGATASYARLGTPAAAAAGASTGGRFAGLVAATRAVEARRAGESAAAADSAMDMGRGRCPAAEGMLPAAEGKLPAAEGKLPHATRQGALAQMSCAGAQAGTRQGAAPQQPQQQARMSAATITSSTEVRLIVDDLTSRLASEITLVRAGGEGGAPRSSNSGPGDGAPGSFIAPMGATTAAACGGSRGAGERSSNGGGGGGASTLASKRSMGVLHAAADAISAPAAATPRASSGMARRRGSSGIRGAVSGGGAGGVGGVARVGGDVREARWQGDGRAGRMDSKFMHLPWWQRYPARVAHGWKVFMQQIDADPEYADAVAHR